MDRTPLHPTELALLCAALIVACATIALPAPANTVRTEVVSAEELADGDHDGIPDLFDLCPNGPNTGLPDSDGDGIRDDCDLTPHGDGVMQLVVDGRHYEMAAPLP